MAALFRGYGFPVAQTALWIETESEGRVPLRLEIYGSPQSSGSFGQELFDDLVSAVALTEFHQARKMEFHSGFDFACWNVLTARFQTLRQFFGAAEHAHRLAVHVRLQEQ
jgi:hypothetical protein